VAGQKPKRGWIYMINPYRVSLRCKSGHNHVYDLTEPGEVECETASCSLVINSSRVLRGSHPYIVWINDELPSVQTFTAIPLTSQRTLAGSPTVYPIVNNSRNGLTNISYALIHQFCTIDGNCFKNADGDWSTRIGQLEARDKNEIEERLKFTLGFSNELTDDWFRQNVNPEFFKKAFGFLADDVKMKALEDLIDGVD
jgi:mRNA interferase MazF